MMGTRQIFRENLKFYRKRKGLSQEKLSEIIGFGETYITEIESRHKFPKPETIDIIAQKLGIEPFQFFKPLEYEEYEKKNKEQEEKAKINEIVKILQKSVNAVFDSTLIS
ncbi:MAG: helix-turn-helix transcriptional regulator [Treponema sp.]|nr:helix-turn-helix transcriptional regulator [Treponema sp.]